MKKIFTFIYVTTVFYQCTQPITNPINEPEKKLVISSFFTADESMTVWVGYPHDILIDTLLYEANATVKLYEDGQFIENLNHTSEGHYQSNYYLKTGKTYKIEVETDELSVSAEDVIPEQVLADSAFYEFVDLGNWEAIQKYRFQFQDIASVENYYEFFFLKVYYDNFKNLWQIAFVVDAIVNDPIIDGGGFPNFVFSDKLIDGQLYKMNISMEFSAANDSIHSGANFDFSIDDYENYLVFRTISKQYYDFQKSWEQHYDNQNIIRRSENRPNEQLFLFGEVSPLYTNIDNGYGIFVAYQEQIIPFEE